MMSVTAAGPGPPTKYLFIDGGYLRKEYEAAMLDFFGERGEIDVQQIRAVEKAERAFYYDCLDDKQRPGESEPEFRQRLSQVEVWFNGIRSLPGFHFRPGTLAGRRQKEVDVLLAVDALTHAFYGNMKRAVLLTGDLDFRPVVEALIRLGTYTVVRSVKRSASEPLHWAADEGLDAHSNDVDQSFQSDADQIGAKRRRALSV